MSEQTATEISNVKTEISRDLSGSTGRFAELVAAGTPTPGGGSVAAYCGVLAAALGRMMCNLTIGKKKYEQAEPAVREIREELARTGVRLSELIDEDAASFERVMAAYRMPKESADEQAARDAAIEAAATDSIAVPHETARCALELLRLLARLSKLGNPNAFPDLTTGSQLALVAVKGASYNIGVNLPMLKDRDAAARWRREIDGIADESAALARQIEGEMLARM